MCPDPKHSDSPELHTDILAPVLDEPIAVPLLPVCLDSDAVINEQIEDARAADLDLREHLVPGILDQNASVGLEP